MTSTTNKRQIRNVNSEDDDFEVKRPRKVTKVVSSKQLSKKLTKQAAMITPQKVKHFPKTQSVGTQTKSKKDKITTLQDTNLVKKEFPVGSIVGINGRDLDYGRYKVRKHAPTFYGVVDPHANHTYEGSNPVAEGWTYVTFVVSGEYEWYDKNEVNTLSAAYHDTLLTLCSYPPVDSVNYDPITEDDLSRWFTKLNGHWIIKVQETPCYGCGSPWCMLHLDRAYLCGMISDVDSSKHLTIAREKRFRCYRNAVSRRWGVLGYQQRKRVG